LGRVEREEWSVEMGAGVQNAEWGKTVPMVGGRARRPASAT